MIAPPVMGSDPGTKGGLAVLGADGHPLYILALQPGMPEVALMLEIRAAVSVLRGAGGNTCFMEKVGFIKGDGGKGSFTFGGVYKFVRGCLLSHDVAICDVYPVMWQAKMECLTGGNKNVSKARAQALFPNIKMTHAIADALLIARYGQAQLAL